LRIHKKRELQPLNSHRKSKPSLKNPAYKPKIQLRERKSNIHSLDMGPFLVFKTIGCHRKIGPKREVLYFIVVIAVQFESFHVSVGQDAFLQALQALERKFLIGDNNPQDMGCGN
jgi:hypothetical protein